MDARCDFVNFGSRFYKPLASVSASRHDTSPIVTHISLVVRTQCEHSASSALRTRCDFVNFGSRFHKPLAWAVVRRHDTSTITTHISLLSITTHISLLSITTHISLQTQCVGCTESEV